MYFSGRDYMPMTPALNPNYKFAHPAKLLLRVSVRYLSQYYQLLFKWVKLSL